MFDLPALENAFKMLMNWDVLLAIPAGLLYSIIVGAIPGFTTSMAITTLLPLTYVLNPLSAIVVLASAYGGAIYGGSITAILLHTPGTPASAATAIEGYAMTQKGEASRALGLATTASSIGGAFSYLFVFFVMVPISWFALRFSSPELFAIAVFGVTILAVIRGSTLAKGIAAGFFGFLLGLVGMTAYGQTRATFGRVELIEGFPTVTVLIGLLAFSQVFTMLEQKFIVQSGKEFEPNFRDMLKGSVEAVKDWFNLIRSALIGTFVGLMPAAGSSIASFISYNEASRNSKVPFGNGNPSGIVASEAANNASEGGAMATMLSLGIPGSPSSAIIMGALLIHGIRPGPKLFIPKEYDPYSGMTFVYAIILTQIIAALLTWPMGLAISKRISRVIKIETKVLAPLIAFLCVVGSFASRSFIFDASIMLVFGLIGFVFSKYGYPPVAIVLGIILGPIADGELMRSAMLFFGNPWMIFTRPIVIVLFAISFAALAYSAVSEFKRSKNLLRKAAMTDRQEDKTMPGMTMTEKILAVAAGKKSVRPGEIVNARVNALMMTDLKGPYVFKVLEEELGTSKIRDGLDVVFVLDHLGPAHDIKSAQQFKACREAARKYALPYFYDLGRQGIGHQVMCEDGYVLPGTVVAGIDSHSTTYGALGAVSFGISPTEGAVILATGALWLKVPETTRFTVTGNLPRRVSGKDIFLHIIGMTKWNGEVLYKAVEFTGPAISALSVSDRMAMCNMVAEMGAKNGIIAPDDKTREYLARLPEKRYDAVLPDPDAVYSHEYTVDVSSLSPRVSVPHRIDDVRPVEDVAGRKIDQAFLGSCTNGRLEDLMIAAEILKERKVHPDVRLIVVPASQKIYLEAVRNGTIEILAEAGAAVLTPNCAACAGIGSGNIASGEVCISSTNRNFEGRMGAKDSEVYLASPATVAASAVEGVIADPRKY